MHHPKGLQMEPKPDTQEAEEKAQAERKVRQVTVGQTKVQWRAKVRTELAQESPEEGQTYRVQAAATGGNWCGCG